LIYILEFNFISRYNRNGNINILTHRKDDFKVKILNPSAHDNIVYIREVEDYMEDLKDIDIFVASAGFDQGIQDWGNLLYPNDYTKLGELMREYSELLCQGRRYALLEGGYNHSQLSINVDAFCQGFK
jgi:acetoin utilization deacetylase AcuC-like enzyme